jgi:hypothetical protein
MKYNYHKLSLNDQVDLRRAGNVSQFVEWLLQAHKEKRLLDPSELL